MLRILKYLKPHWLKILIIVGLLFVQAASDLSLPDYMARIINVGIQQEGIEDAVPAIIRQGSMDKVTLFMSDEDKATVLSAYELISQARLDTSIYEQKLKKYPALATDALYELTAITPEQKEILNGIFGKPMLVITAIDKLGLAGVAGDNPMIAAIPPGSDPYALISMMPSSFRANMIADMEEKFASMPPSIVTQSAPLYIKGEYEAIGIDVTKAQTNYILRAGLNMLLIAMISMMAAIIVGLLGSQVAAAMSMSLRSDVFGKVVAFSSVEMDKFSTASLITRTTNDIQQIQMMTIMLFRIIIYAPILGIGGVLKVLRTDTGMSWIIGAAVAVISVFVLFLFASVMPKFKKVQKLIDKLNLVTREALTGLPVIRAFSKQTHEEARFDGVNRDLTATNLFVNRIMGMMFPVMMLLMNGVVILIVWVGSHGIDEGSLQVGDMMAFIQYTMQIIMSFLMITAVSIMIPRASVSLQRVSEVLKTDFSIKDPKHPVKMDGRVKGKVEFRDVSFKYPDAEECMLSKVNFVAEPGKVTAIVGGTGSGKSTLINLIPRFFDATEGQVLIDGVDIRNMSQHDLRERIGYVPQKGILFSGTIESNLRYGRDSATDDELKDAAETAQALDFIIEKSEGFSSEIAQGGTNVSGGQKQRLSIARALVKKPEIYIFDDTFSALDFKTDAMLRRALSKKTEGATMLIVAQRIGTIMHADKIIVLDEGEVVGIGRHEDLLKDCEVYRQIATSQLSAEELAR